MKFNDKCSTPRLVLFTVTNDPHKNKNQQNNKKHTTKKTLIGNKSVEHQFICSFRYFDVNVLENVKHILSHRSDTMIIGYVPVLCCCTHSLNIVPLK